MSSDYDATEFVDGDLQARKLTQAASPGGPGESQRAPTRQEVDSKVAAAQQKLTELKRAQDELERERAALEETRRRQSEFQTGRQEMVHNLTRGLGLLEEAEFTARRDAEQMSKALVDLRDALAKVESIHEETWSRDNFSVELTRSLTTLENARMEWNSARLKFPVLSQPDQAANTPAPERSAPGPAPLAGLSFGALCRLGLAFTWPLVLVALLGIALFLAFHLRR